MRHRNPDPSSLALGALVFGGSFWVAGNSGALPSVLQDVWNDLFNQGKPKKPKVTTPPGMQAPATPVPPTKVPQQATPAQITPASMTPAQGGSLPSVSLPDVGVGLYLDFWTDTFSYTPGETITLYGRLYLKGIGGESDILGLPGATIDIVDPDVDTVWLWAQTQWDGTWSIQYTAQETLPWRSYARFSGYAMPFVLPMMTIATPITMGAYETGILEFFPIEGVQGGFTQGQQDELQKAYAILQDVWNRYSQQMLSVDTALNDALHAVWTKVTAALQGGGGEYSKIAEEYNFTVARYIIVITGNSPDNVLSPAWQMNYYP